MSSTSDLYTLAALLAEFNVENKKDQFENTALAFKGGMFDAPALKKKLNALGADVVFDLMCFFMHGGPNAFKNLQRLKSVRTRETILAPVQKTIDKYLKLEEKLAKEDLHFKIKKQISPKIITMSRFFTAYPGLTIRFMSKCSKRNWAYSNLESDVLAQPVLLLGYFQSLKLEVILLFNREITQKNLTSFLTWIDYKIAKEEQKVFPERTPFAEFDAYYASKAQFMNLGIKAVEGIFRENPLESKTTNEDLKPWFLVEDKTLTITNKMQMLLDDYLKETNVDLF